MSILPNNKLQSRGARISELRAVVHRGERQLAVLRLEAQYAPDLIVWRRVRREAQQVATEVASARASIAQLEHSSLIERTALPSRRYSERVTR